MKDSKNNKSNISSIIKLLVLITVVIVIPVYVLIVKGDIVSFLKEPSSIKELASFLREYKTESIFIYLGFQILQIIISVIPGQVFQMAAGYLYGFVPGLALSLLGACLGSTIAYFLAVFLGRDSLGLFIKKDTLDTWVTRLNTKKAYLIIFLLYLIPGLPKDLIAYPTGIARINIKAFLILSLTGRLPAMAASVLMGALYEDQSYTAMIIIASVSIVLFLICFIKRGDINRFMDGFYNKMSGNATN